MTTTTSLLDTPKRKSLQTQSASLRAALKEFEHTFAATHDGAKPGKDDIKADKEVAAKYSLYNKVRDVLGGRLDLSVLNAPSEKENVKRRTTRVSTEAGKETPRKQRIVGFGTPKKQDRGVVLGGIEEEGIAVSPHKFALTAIGPTPHRDGKVLGLFDLMSATPESVCSTSTPSSRKRKLDDLIDAPNAKMGSPLKTIQTPSRRQRHGGDLLAHLRSASEGEDDENETTPHVRKYSRTPQSEAKKFALNTFFATPNTRRYLNFTNSTTPKKSPEKLALLKETPQKQAVKADEQHDATPPYLKRSTSFKDRLRSVADEKKIARPLPPTLRHFRSATGNARQSRSLELETTTRTMNDDQDGENDDDEDEWDVLRDIENVENDFMLGDSQNANAKLGEGEMPTRAYKKKGQKRTTRRANIKPVQVKVKEGAKFVAPTGREEDQEQAEEEEHDEETELVEETQLHHDFDDNDFDDADLPSDFEDDLLGDATMTGQKEKAKDKAKPAVSGAKKPGMINPNAVSHQNFRSLKIKNKNSKAKAGGARGKFGKKRR